MFENIQEEYMLNFYLHRYVMSEVTYEEFRTTVIAQINSSNKSEEEILAEVKEIIDGFNQEVTDEVVNEEI